MAAVARVVEAVGVGAYLGGATLIVDKNILSAAASILTIEARHQSFLNILNGASAIPQAFDIALTPPQVLALAGGFITSGCDLGIPANAPLAITNTDAVVPGTTLTFDSPALAGVDPATLSCQMITGGGDTNGTALSFPLSECIVPTGINGPVVIFLTNDTQPLLADINVQNPASIVCGPTIAFIDAQADALGALVRQGANPVQITDSISPSQANDVLSSASVTATATDAVLTSIASESPAPTDSVATDSVATDSLAVTDSLVASDPAATPVDTASSVATPEELNAAPTSAPQGPVKVIGHSNMCVSCLSSESVGLVY